MSYITKYVSIATWVCLSIMISLLSSLLSIRKSEILTGLLVDLNVSINGCFSTEKQTPLMFSFLVCSMYSKWFTWLDFFYLWHVIYVARSVFSNCCICNMRIVSMWWFVRYLGKEYIVKAGVVLLVVMVLDVVMEVVIEVAVNLKLLRDLYWTSGKFKCFHQRLLFGGKTNTSDFFVSRLQHALRVVHAVGFFWLVTRDLRNTLCVQ